MDPEKHLWTYSIKNSTGKVLTHTGTQRQIDEDLQAVRKREG